MGKRSEFEKKPRDYYATIDPGVLVPEFVKEVRGKKYAEVCCGAGDLISLLKQCDATATVACDIEPQREYGFACFTKDATTLEAHHLLNTECIITNPPYTWDVFNSLLLHLKCIYQRPIWLLLPADWMHNKRMAPHMRDCSQVISVGRLYWEDNKVRGKDNYCWYKFIRGWNHQTTFKTRGD